MNSVDLVATITASEHSAQCLVAKVNDAILFPLIALMMALAFLYFLWGCFEYIRDSASAQGREKGQQHIMYGTIGMLIMVSAYSILSIGAGTFGITLFDSARVACGAPPVVTSDLGIGGGFTGGIDPGGAFGFDDIVIPGTVTPVDPSLPTGPGLLPGDALLEDELVIDTLPPVGPSCPEGQVRYHVTSRCGLPASFEIRNEDQIEVSCGTDFNCGVARTVCTDHYGGVDSNVMGGSGGNRYLICGDSHFSGFTPVSNVVVYESAPAAVFVDPPVPARVGAAASLANDLSGQIGMTDELIDRIVTTAYDPGASEFFVEVYLGTYLEHGEISQATYDAIISERFGPSAAAVTAPANDYSGSVVQSGNATLVSPSFEETFEAYVAPYVVESAPDEAAIKEAWGADEVLFMVPAQIMFTHTGGGGSQPGGSDSQQEARCNDLGGEWITENEVTSVTMNACLR